MKADFWNTRYRADGLAYGAVPNAFVADQARHRLLVPTHVADLGSGEGRNALFLARQGHTVTAVDYADVGLSKTQRLARAEGLTVETLQADIAHWRPDRQWEAVVIAFLHLPPADRPHLYTLIQHILQPGGFLIAEWFHPNQVIDNYQTGGPRSAEMMISLEELHQHFDTAGVVSAAEVVRTLEESRHHKGQAAVVQFVWQKPQTTL